MRRLFLRPNGHGLVLNYFFITFTSRAQIEISPKKPSYCFLPGGFARKLSILFLAPFVRPLFFRSQIALNFFYSFFIDSSASRC